MYWKLLFDIIDSSFKEIQCSILETLTCYWYYPGQYFCIVYNFKNCSFEAKDENYDRQTCEFIICHFKQLVDINFR